jgi:hypothetical protein
MDVGNAASRRERLLPRDAFAVSDFRSLMMHLRNPDRQQAGSLYVEPIA